MDCESTAVQHSATGVGCELTVDQKLSMDCGLMVAQKSSMDCELMAVQQ